MSSIPFDLSPEKIETALRSRLIGRPLEVLAEVGSTNDAAMAAGRAGTPEGWAVIADRQSAGRGRRGRTWVSPPGVGLYTSILLRPVQPAETTPLLTLVAGLAVAGAIGEVANLDIRLKWPNDALVDGRKVAGILTELASVDARASYVVVGIGVNVNHGAQDFPEELRPLATSLAQAAGQMILRCDLVAALYNHLDRWYALFQEGDSGVILAQGRACSATLGRLVEILDEAGRWRGLALDLDGDGALLVRQESGVVRRVIAGDVSIREPLAS